MNTSLGKIRYDEGYFHIVAADGTDLGYEETYAAAVAALEAWNLLRSAEAERAERG